MPEVVGGSRRFCVMASEPVVSFVKDAIRYGPYALQKLQDFHAYVSPKAESRWPQRVKLEFSQQNHDGQPTFVTWSPASEYLHDVFYRTQKDIYDFDLFFTDKDGDRMQLHPTKGGIEEFLASHQSPRLQVAWRQASTLERISEKIHVVKCWMTGSGAATEQQVTVAQAAVEKSGGQIIPSQRGRSLIDHKGYKLEDWEKVVPGLAVELGLSEQEQSSLLNAAFREEGRGAHFLEKFEGNRLSTTFISYHIFQSDGRINIVYGRHEAMMEAASSGTAFPMENCIRLGGRTFTVLPPASPHFNHVGKEMKGKSFDIPTGWKMVDSAAEDFDNVAKEVIGQYYWGASYLITQGKDSVQAWHTSSVTGDKGTCANSDYSHAFKQAGARCKFEDVGDRVLIEEVPSVAPDLVNNWKRYVELSAQREWSQRLALPQPQDSPPSSSS